jgi:hypothetical protein
MQRFQLRFDNLVPARNLPDAELSWDIDSAEAAASSAPEVRWGVRVVETVAPIGREGELSWDIRRAETAASRATEKVMVLKKPCDKSVRDWAIYLLHNAAEIEHALLIQYLYARYSLNNDASGPAANDPSTTIGSSSWTATIRGIAIEEMGHLLTVQNVLRFVGGPISFAREDFPIPTEVYPFPFQLEPLTKDVLAKYAYAEMPSGNIDEKFISAAEKAVIETQAFKAAGVPGGQFANHVGTLYATLIDVLSDPTFQSPSTDGFPHDTEPFQAMPGFGWVRLQGNGSIVRSTDADGTVHPVNLRGPRLLSVNSIADALAALSFIARQGEASDKDSLKRSHFGRFLDIYRQFPEKDAVGWKIPPAFRVASNPTTFSKPATPGTISNEATQLWARLFDLRYRILLASLAHATAIPRVKTAGDAGPSNATAAIVGWIFQVMLEQPLSISQLAPLLAQMPLKTPATAEMAGAPFSMPFSLPIPDRDRERWQYHLDLLDSSAAVVAALKMIKPDPKFAAFGAAQSDLDNLLSADAVWRKQIKTFM